MVRWPLFPIAGDEDSQQGSCIVFAAPDADNADAESAGPLTPRNRCKQPPPDIIRIGLQITRDTRNAGAGGRGNRQRHGMPCAADVLPRIRGPVGHPQIAGVIAAPCAPGNGIARRDNHYLVDPIDATLVAGAPIQPPDEPLFRIGRPAIEFGAGGIVIEARPRGDVGVGHAARRRPTSAVCPMIPFVNE